MVKEGYKQTDIGVIPEDWEIKRYDELFCFLTTATYSRSQLSDDGAIHYIHYGDIHTKYHFKLDLQKNNLPKIKNELLKKYPLLKDGDIIMVDASEDYEGISKSVEITNISDAKVISGLHTFLLRDKEENFINGFKAYLSSNHLVRNQFNSLATGMKVFGVSKGNLKNILVPIPPKSEQKAIAKALSDTDELITSMGNLIAKKEAIKQGTMQQLLTGKKRLSGFSGECKEKKLGDIFNITAGGDLKKEQYSEMQDAKYKYPIFANSVSQLGLYGYSTFFSIEKESITVTARGNLGVAFYRNRPFVAIGRLLILQPKIKVDCFFCTESINLTLNFANESTSVPQLTAPQISQYEIKLPPTVQEQHAIAKILSDMDDEIEMLRTKRSKTQAIKEAMMSELLNGKTRLTQGNLRCGTISKQQTIY